MDNEDYDCKKHAHLHIILAWYQEIHKSVETFNVNERLGNLTILIAEDV